jgi:FtsP/CotA-like multicopper oxidase with cupredoxin domain
LALFGTEFIRLARKDTVWVSLDGEINVIRPFEIYNCLFLYHCDNLEHEDLGMMRL